MDSVLNVIQSPIFLGTLLVLGAASLIRLIMNRDPSLRRSYRGDRRRHKGKMPATPFIDSDGIEVTQDRRQLPDRRRHQLLAMQEEMKEGNTLS